MPYIRPWLLIAIPIIWVLESCAVAGQASDHALSGAGDNLTIDLDAGVAKASDWEIPVENCSTEDFNCVRVIGIVDIAFPKTCSTVHNQTIWNSPVGKFRVVAPQAHYGLPYGSYISENHPKALLFYGRDTGFSELRLVKYSPAEAMFDPNDFSRKYRLVMKGSNDFYSCT